MTFRTFSQKILEPVGMWTMILGIIFLCQPWSEFLHMYSVTIILVGLVTFLVAIHVPAPETNEDHGGIDG